MIRVMIFSGEERTDLFCDKCGNGYTWDHIISKSLLIRIGRRKGWSMGKLHLCERCRERRQQNEA